MQTGADAPPEPPWWKLCFGSLSREVREFWDWEDAQLEAELNAGLNTVEVTAREVPGSPLEGWSAAQWMYFLGHTDKAQSFTGWQWDRERQTIVFTAVKGLRVVCPELLVERLEFGRFVGEFDGPASFQKLGD